jgi:hypothetical protein
MRNTDSINLGKFLPKSGLEHLGRADQRAKISGQRVEQGDITATMLLTGFSAEVGVVTWEAYLAYNWLEAYLITYPQADASMDAAKIHDSQ